MPKARKSKFAASYKRTFNKQAVNTQTSSFWKDVHQGAKRKKKKYNNSKANQIKRVSGLIRTSTKRGGYISFANRALSGRF